MRVERLLPGPFQRLRGLYEPRIPAEERESLKLILETFRKFAAAEIDSKKIDDEAEKRRQVAPAAVHRASVVRGGRGVK